VNAEQGRETCEPRGRGRFALAALSALLALAAAEAVTALLFPVYLAPADFFDDFYVPEPELGYRMRPHFSGTLKQDYTSRIEINAQGLRDADYGRKRPGALRVVAVGDSYTFGAGVDLAESWPKRLEAELRSRGLDAEVVNGGTSGYGTLQYAALVRRLLPVYAPDLVVVMATFNDPGNDVATERGIFPSLKIGQHPAKRWLKRHSHLAKRAWLAWLKLAAPEFSFADAGTLHRHATSEGSRGERSRRGFQLFDAAIHDLIDRAEGAGVPIVFTASADSRDPVTRHLAALCAREGVPFVDVFEDIRSGAVRVSWRGRNSAGHWSPAGHAEFARVLAGEVAARLAGRSAPGALASLDR